MTDFVRITPEGRFSLDGKRWMCNSVIYFGRHPGMMENWFTETSWPINRPQLDGDFGKMEQLGINHSALFLRNEMFFDGGKPIEIGYKRLDEVIAAAAKHGVRVTLFCGPFIDSEGQYHRVTGKEWTNGNRWLPPFNEDLFEAYVAQAAGFARRYRDNPWVFGYADRIDRFHKGFDNVTIPFNLKEEWAAWLHGRYGTMAKLREACGGSLEGDPADFDRVLMPQESCWNAGLANPLGFDYILWQKTVIGNSQARWDARMLEIAPDQVMWTPFEGCTLDWAMLDGFTPEPKKLKAIWMEYYNWQALRTQPVGPYEEWAHTREFVNPTLHFKSPTIYNSAYLLTRNIKQSVQQPVVMCHGGRLSWPITGMDRPHEQCAMYDRVNAACLAADGDGWHYWSLIDDWESSLAHAKEQHADPTAFYWQGESTGIFDSEGCPRPVTAVIHEYARELKRIEKADPPEKKSDTLILSSAARMYSLFRRMAFPTAAAVNGALTRLGVEADYLWTSRNDIKITPEALASYRLIVIADNVYQRDYREMPGMLLDYVRSGGVLYLPLDKWDSFEDEHGIAFDCPAIRELAGVDPARAADWPGAGAAVVNWPFGDQKANEPNADYVASPRLNWGVCPDHRFRAPLPRFLQQLGFRSRDDGDAFTLVPGLVAGAEVIAVGKFETGTRPFVYRHKLGQGAVIVNAWTNNVYRDSDVKIDHGGWEYDFILSLAIETANVRDVDYRKGASIWLRNSFGYFWRDL